MWLIVIVALGLTIAVYRWLSNVFWYWDSIKIHNLKPWPIIGNCNDAWRRSFNLYMRRLYRQTSQGVLGIHILSKPAIVVKDPLLIEKIMVADYKFFNCRRIETNHSTCPVTNSLFRVYGHGWEDTRITLSALFTSEKVEIILGSIQECHLKLKSLIDSQSQHIDTSQAIFHFTIQFAAKSILGESIGTDNNKLIDIMTDYFTRRTSTMCTVAGIADSKWAYTFSGSDSKQKCFNELKSMISQVVKRRLRTGETKNDLLQEIVILMEHKEIHIPDAVFYLDGSPVPQYNLDEMVSHAATFFIKIVASCSSTMTFLLHELALNQGIQEQLRAEVTSNKGGLSYDDLRYLNMVISETLRKYPVYSLLLRTTVRAYPVMQENLNFIIDPDVLILIPTLCIHRDPTIYEEPNKFKPERFSEENKSGLNPGSFLPFGNGPRECMGQKIAKGFIASTVGFLLSHYKFSQISAMKTDQINLKTVDFMNFPAESVFLQVTDCDS